MFDTVQKTENVEVETKRQTLFPTENEKESEKIDLYFKDLAYTVTNKYKKSLLSPYIGIFQLLFFNKLKDI